VVRGSTSLARPVTDGDRVVSKRRVGRPKGSKRNSDQSQSFNRNSIERYRRNPAAFVTECLINPETNEPFELLPAEITFLEHAFKTDANGRLLYPELVYSCPKKSGKTAFGAMFAILMVLIYGGQFAEGYCLANDLEQAQGRVFQAAKRIVEKSPALRDEATVTRDKIEFNDGSTITAIASDYAGSAGSNPTISVFDELWGYTSERSRRLFDEMVPPPTRRIAARLIVTYAGYSGESLLLEELYKRGMEQPEIATDLRAGAGILMFWSHVPVAPWQDQAWLDQMRSQLRPNAYARLIENRFTSSVGSFIDADAWDAIVDPDAHPLVMNRALPVWVGVDASTKRDSTAIAVVTFNPETKRVHLVGHRIFQPTTGEPLNFESTIERTLYDLRARFRIKGIWYDPWQMSAVAQRLRNNGLPMAEFPQTPANLTEIGTTLYELILGRGIVAYPDDQIRLAVLRTAAKEMERGFRLTKEKSSYKIDIVVALAMACRAAVEQGQMEIQCSWGGFGVYTGNGTGAISGPGQAPARESQFGDPYVPITEEEQQKANRSWPGCASSFVSARMVSTLS
jgi:phage terminase large subunit-like protein